MGDGTPRQYVLVHPVAEYGRSRHAGQRQRHQRACNPFTLRPRELLLRRPLPFRGQRPLRRFVAFLQQEMGPFPVGGRRMAYLPGELLQELRRDRVYQQPQAACIVGTPRQRVYLLELHRVPDPLDRQLLRFQRYAGSRCGHHRAFEQGYLVGDFRTDQHRSRHRHLEPLLTDSRHLLQEDHRYSDETAHSAVADRQRKRRPLSECRQHGEQRSRTDAQLPPDLSQQDVRRRHVHDHFPA